MRRGTCPECGRPVAGAEQGGILAGQILLRKHKPPGSEAWCSGWGSLVDPLPRDTPGTTAATTAREKE